MEQKAQATPAQIGVQTIYFNGIGVGMGSIDMSIILNHNNIPTTELKLTYSVAKTLAANINEVIANYEKHSGNHVIGAVELNEKVAQSVAKKA